MLRKLFVVCLPVCLLGVIATFAVPMFADTITDYTIAFTTASGSPAPASGSFTYNSTTPTFSNFLVKWDGITFDATGLNSFGQFVINGCAGQTNTPAYAFTIMAQTAALCPNAHYEWLAEDTQAPPEFDFLMTSSQQTNVDIGGNTPNAPLNGKTANGNWTIAAISTTQTPEPGTISLLLSGVAGVGLLVGIKRAQGEVRGK